MTDSEGLDLPPRLVDLVKASLWSTEGPYDNRVPFYVISAWDPEAHGIHFSEPAALREELEQTPDFWKTFGCLEQLDVETCAVIGDFGLGSDSAILIDCANKNFPVLHLDWRLPDDSTPGSGGSTRWTVLSPDFDSFVDLVFPAGPGRRPTELSIFYRVRWAHGHDDEPVTIYLELDSFRGERRKIEVFRDGRVEQCGPGVQNTARPSVGPIPSFESISAQPEFEIVEISPEDFFTKWPA